MYANRNLAILGGEPHGDAYGPAECTMDGRTVREMSEEQIEQIILKYAAAALAAAKTAAGFFMHRLRIFVVAVQCVLSLVTIAFLWYKVYGMQGRVKEIGRAALTSTSGRLLTAGLAAWTLLSAAVKIWIEKSAALRAGADIAAVFLMCAGIWYGVYKVRQLRRRPLDLWAAQDV
jgi:hypothetical protein